MDLFDQPHKKQEEYDVDVYPDQADIAHGVVSENKDDLQRRLGNRCIQLLAIGGSIGTALFVSIGDGLYQGGPAGLFLGYSLQSIMLGLVNNCIAEMTVMMPVSGGFIRLAGEWVDEALGFMAGWNFFLYEALLIPFEITALNEVLKFWRDDIPAAAVIATAIALYAILNVIAVRVYGEAEFWLSGGKVILILMLFSFTFVTMCGGNPKHDAYGFRYWNNPGPFQPYLDTGALGRFEGFLAGLWSALFCVVGPEYISMVAAEAKRPRIYIKSAFKTVYFRFCLFFIIGSVAVGVLISARDPSLVAVWKTGTTSSGTAAASPYVIAMQNLGINGLPDLVNALLVTSIFSAGNTYTYCATRSLYGLALEARAPKFLRYCTKQGVPIACFCVVMCFPFLAFLQLSKGSSKVLTYLVSLTTGGGLINYVVMTITYICFYNACKVQGLDRRTLPYTGWFQPYCGYIAAVWMVIVLFCYGYPAFKPWAVDTFFTNYTMLILSVILFVGWKVIKRTRFVPPHQVDLVWERPVIDEYEASFIDPPVSFWQEMVQMVGIGRKKGGNDRRVTNIVS